MTGQNINKKGSACTSFRDAAMTRTALGFGGAGTALFTVLSLLPYVPELGGGPSILKTFAAAVTGFIAGGGLGLFIGSPSYDGKKTLDGELACRGDAKGKRADTRRLADANKSGVHFNL
jgi:hypothetical protein